MEDVEERALSTYHSPPLFWKRYVDEQSIDFTVELECERKLAFLDTEITHHDNGSLTTTVYRKKTNTDKYLSYHPLAQVAKTLFNRAKRICSSFPERVDEEMKVTNALKKNGYPDGMILRNSKFHPEVAQSEKSDEEEQPKATVILPYIRHVSAKTLFNRAKRICSFFS